MFFWMIPLLVTVGILSWILIRALKQYENENAAAAHAKVSVLEDRLNNLQERLETLETIESNSLLDAERGKEMLDSAESLSLGRKPISE